MAYGFTAVVIASIVAFWSFGRLLGRLPNEPARLPAHPATPLAEAERILAIRYARAELSGEAYERALAILRR